MVKTRVLMLMVGLAVGVGPGGSVAANPLDVARLSPAEKRIHHCWVSRDALQKIKWKRGNFYRYKVQQSRRDCLKARQLAKQEYQRTGRKPFNGQAIPKPGFTIDRSIEWFLQ